MTWLLITCSRWATPNRGVAAISIYLFQTGDQVWYQCNHFSLHLTRTTLCVTWIFKAYNWIIGTKERPQFTWVRADTGSPAACCSCRFCSATRHSTFSRFHSVFRDPMLLGGRLGNAALKAWASSAHTAFRCTVVLVSFRKSWTVSTTAWILRSRKSFCSRVKFGMRYVMVVSMSVFVCDWVRRLLLRYYLLLHL